MKAICFILGFFCAFSVLAQDHEVGGFLSMEGELTGEIYKVASNDSGTVLFIDTLNSEQLNELILSEGFTVMEVSDEEDLLKLHIDSVHHYSTGSFTHAESNWKVKVIDKNELTVKSKEFPVTESAIIEPKKVKAISILCIIWCCNGDCTTSEEECKEKYECEKCEGVSI